MKDMTWTEVAEAYCTTQEQTTEGLLAVLQAQRTKYEPEGWMLLECQVLDSSMRGTRVLLPYGPRNSYKTPPGHPISPRGLASDMSTVMGLLNVEALP